MSLPIENNLPSLSSSSYNSNEYNSENDDDTSEDTCHFPSDPNYSTQRIENFSDSEDSYEPIEISHSHFEEKEIYTTGKRLIFSFENDTFATNYIIPSYDNILLSFCTTESLSYHTTLMNSVECESIYNWKIGNGQISLSLKHFSHDKISLFIETMSKCIIGISFVKENDSYHHLSFVCLKSQKIEKIETLEKEEIQQVVSIPENGNEILIINDVLSLKGFSLYPNAMFSSMFNSNKSLEDIVEFNGNNSITMKSLHIIQWY